MPFTPCKKGYIPVNAVGKHMCACPFHDAARRKRLKVDDNDGLAFRPGEVDLNIFWKKQVDDTKP